MPTRSSAFVLGAARPTAWTISTSTFLKILIRGLILLLALMINVYARRACAETFSPCHRLGALRRLDYVK